jgi:hypothetical protein
MAYRDNTDSLRARRQHLAAELAEARAAASEAAARARRVRHLER